MKKGANRKVKVVVGMRGGEGKVELGPLTGVPNVVCLS